MNERAAAVIRAGPFRARNAGARKMCAANKRGAARNARAAPSMLSKPERYAWASLEGAT